MFLIDSRINSRENNLNLIRLIAAISVTFGHSFAMVKGHHYEFFSGINSAVFGFYAVAVFFGLSGFLITQSFFRNQNYFVFLKARLLRLLPGLFFSNTITAILIVIFVNYDFSLLFSLQFLGHSFLGTTLEPYSFSQVFSHLHYNNTNGSLWTLSYEFRMYILVLILGSLGVLRKRFLFFILSLVLFYIAYVQIDVLFYKIFYYAFYIKNYEATYLSLPFSFILGILFYLFKEKIKLNFYLSLVLLILSFYLNVWILKNIAWIYFAFSFGYLPQAYLKKLNFKFDYSYGIYILSWPIQQVILHNQWAASPIELFVKTMCIVIPLSAISWHFIEKPALQFKN